VCLLRVLATVSSNLTCHVAGSRYPFPCERLAGAFVTIRTDPDNSRYRVAGVSPQLMVAGSRTTVFRRRPLRKSRSAIARGEEQIPGIYHFSDLERDRLDGERRGEGRREIYHYVVCLMVRSRPEMARFNASVYRQVTDHWFGQPT